MITTTEPFASKDERSARLQQIACDIDNYRLENDLSDARLLKIFPLIGSTKTFRKLVEGDTSELDVEKQLRNYESSALSLKDRRAADLPEEKIFESFANVQNVLKAVTRAKNEPSQRRCVIVAGPTGTGKSTARAAVLKAHSHSVVNCEADETWRDSLNVPYAEIIDALSIRRRKQDGESFKLPMFPHARQELILEELNKSQRILIIDECHRMGPRGLNMVTTLINKSLVVPVLFGLPVLLTRLFTSAYEESIQLTGNRLAERVTLESPPADEIFQLFEERGTTFENGKVLENAMGNLVSEAPRFGNWSFVIKVQRECYRFGTKEQRPPITESQFNTAFTTARRRCVQEQKRGN